MVIANFSSKKVFLDTAPLIYFIEGHSSFQAILAALFQLNDSGSFSFLSSSITLLEVLVKPLREGQTKIADQYRNILTAAPGIELADITPEIAEKAAQLRAKYNLKTPDAIQVATSIVLGADYFLTNDIGLKVVADTNVLTLAELQL
ncbi:MAG: PIN domain-containing protein [Chitinophagaceae bacterium]